MLIKAKKAQSVTEYAIMFGVIVAGLIGLQIYFQRGLQGNIKEKADSVGSQFSLRQEYTTENQSRTLRSSRSGYIEDQGNEYWSRSDILASSGESNLGTIQSGWESGIGKAEYAGYEESRTRYVEQNIQGEEIGTHGYFDSGQIGTITPWEEIGVD